MLAVQEKLLRCRGQAIVTQRLAHGQFGKRSNGNVDHAILDLIGQLLNGSHAAQNIHTQIGLPTSHFVDIIGRVTDVFYDDVNCTLVTTRDGDAGNVAGFATIIAIDQAIFDRQCFAQPVAILVVENNLDATCDFTSYRLRRDCVHRHFGFLHHDRRSTAAGTGGTATGNQQQGTAYHQQARTAVPQEITRQRRNSRILVKTEQLVSFRVIGHVDADQARIPPLGNIGVKIAVFGKPHQQSAAIAVVVVDNHVRLIGAIGRLSLIDRMDGQFVINPFNEYFFWRLSGQCINQLETLDSIVRLYNQRFTLICSGMPGDSPILGADDNFDGFAHFWFFGLIWRGHLFWKSCQAESTIKCNTQPKRYRDGQALRTTHT